MVPLLPYIQVMLGKGPKIKKHKSMVFDHQGGRDRPKKNPYSYLKKDLNFKYSF